MNFLSQNKTLFSETEGVIFSLSKGVKEFKNVLTLLQFFRDLRYEG